jgi:mannosyltransferase OCH1-like enzyme
MAATASGIPRIIHQIWIGSNPRPDLWMDSVKEFAAEHGYEYMLWGEKEAARLPWGQHKGLRALYDSFAAELAGRADLIRLLVLYKYGGIYIDADTVILKPAKFAAFLERNTAPAFFGWEELSEAKRKKLGDLGEGLEGQRRLIANGTIPL